MNSQEYGLGRTHDLVLAAVVAAVPPGLVLELGVGYGSTPMLHALCAVKKHMLVSYDHDQNWIDRFMCLKDHWHDFRTFPLEPLMEGFRWSVVFVDHAPAEARVPAIEALIDSTNIFVVHDTEDPLYNYEPTFKKFKYRYDYKRLTPWTSILSNTHPWTIDL